MKKSAFTLVELLVVISIIAILAGIALPVFNKVLEKGKLTTDLNNLRQIGVGLQAYQNDNDSKMPPDGTAGTAILNDGTTSTLYNYTGKSYSLWHSRFDGRTAAEGTSYPVSYGFNKKVLSPTTSGGAGTWNGDFGIAVVSTSKLVVASPCFTGLPTQSSSWSNTAATINCLPDKGTGMTLTGNFYKLMPTLFADSHVDMSMAINYQNGPSGSTSNYLEWDPMTSVNKTGP